MERDHAHQLHNGAVREPIQTANSARRLSRNILSVLVRVGADDLASHRVVRVKGNCERSAEAAASISDPPPLPDRRPVAARMRAGVHVAA